MLSNRTLGQCGGWVNPLGKVPLSSVGRRKLRHLSAADAAYVAHYAIRQDALSPEARTRADELRAAFLERMQSRDHEAMNVGIEWAGRGRTSLNGRLRVGDELRERPRPRREELPLAARLREGGEAWYSSALVGVFLRLGAEPLAQRAGVSVRDLDAWPPGLQLHAYLEAVVEVLVKAIDVRGGDERLAAAWYLDCAMAELDGHTRMKWSEQGGRLRWSSTWMHI